MRILQICFTKIVNSAGGAEKVFCNMSNYFAKENDVVGVCCDDELGLPFYSLDNNVKFINLIEGKKLRVPFCVKLKNEIYRLFKQIGVRLEFPKEVYLRTQINKKLKPILEIEKPDIVVCYELRSMVAIAECGFPLSKIVVMFHMDAENILRSMSEKQEEILCRVNCVQVLLDSYKQLLLSKGYTNVICIGNIVPQYDEINLSAREKTIIHVGRLCKTQKRQHLLIEAFSKISTKYPEWNIKFFGGDSNPKGYDEELKQLINKNRLENQVYLMGKSNEIDAELRKASIFVFPSAFEGFPLALTEAMSMGLPSIGFKTTPAVNELIKNDINGILCNEDVNSLADALEELMRDENKRIDYGRQAKDDMKQYSSEKILGMWDSVIKKVM